MAKPAAAKAAEAAAKNVCASIANHDEYQGLVTDLANKDKVNGELRTQVTSLQASNSELHKTLVAFQKENIKLEQSEKYAVGLLDTERKKAGKLQKDLGEAYSQSRFLPGG